MQLLFTLLAYAFVWIVFIGGCLYSLFAFVLDLVGFRREDPGFEGERLIYRS